MSKIRIMSVRTTFYSRMMKSVASFYRVAAVALILFSALCSTQAQPGYVWAKNFYSTDNPNRAHYIHIDKQGNLYSTGLFEGMMDFDPGPGYYTLNYLSAGYVLKQDPSGNFIWAAAFGGATINDACIAYAVETDQNGDVLITGQFKGIIDFNPGTAPGDTFRLASITNGATYSLDIFVCKLTGSGQFLWAKRIGDSQADVGNDLALDATGNVYVTGYFRQVVDFDPGPGTYTLNSTGTNSAFVLKLDPSGNFVWAGAMGDFIAPYTGTTGYSIAIDNSGNVYSTGNFVGTADFDPGPGTFFLTAPVGGGGGTYVSKLDNNGNFVWAISYGPTSTQTINAGHKYIAIDKKDNIHIAGAFTGTVDFDPGAGTYNLTSAGMDDVYILKINSAGSFIWAKALSGTNFEYVPAIAVDTFSFVYTTGMFRGTVDFDPGAGTYNLTANGNQDGYISVLDSLGNFFCAGKMGGTINSHQITPWSIKVDASKSIFVAGSFFGSIDFDPGAGSVIIPSGGGFENIFTAKFSECLVVQLPEALFTTPDSVFCNPKCISFTDLSKNATSWNWSFPGAVPSSSSSQNPQNICYNSPGQYSVTLIATNDNGSDTLTKTNYIESSTQVVASVSVTASATNICAGTSVSFTATPTNGGAAPAYQWYLNGQQVGTNSPAYSNSALAQNDTVWCVMTSDLQCATGSPAASNRIVMTVTPGPAASVFITASDSSICPGQTATFSATGGNGGANPTYQWKKNGQVVGTNSATYTPPSLNNLDTIVCIMTSDLTCVTGSPATSPPIIISVGSGGNAGIVSAVPDSICEGDVSILSVSGGGGGSGQWQSSGNAATGYQDIAGASQTNYTTPALSASAYYRYYLVNGGCADTTLPVRITVSPMPPQPDLTAPDTLICASDSAQVCAPGNFAAYLWNTGATGNCIHTSLAGGYWVSVTDRNGCAVVSKRKNISVYPASSVSIIRQGDTLSSYNAVAYQWFKDDSPISGATSPVYVASQPGKYSVRILDANGCYSMSTGVMIVTGISDIDPEDALIVYPNPAEKILYVEITKALLNQPYEIYESSGKLVANGYMYSSLVSIDISLLAKGIYYIRLDSIARKIIIQ